MPDPVGLERAADAHAGRPFLHRGALQGCQERGRVARLQRGREVLGFMAASAGRHRCRAGDGARPRDPQGVPRRAPGPLLPGLLPALHRPAAPGPARGAGRGVCAEQLRARRRSQGPARPEEQSGVEDGRLRRAERRGRRTDRLDRLPLGRAGQVEHRPPQRRRWRRDPATTLQSGAPGCGSAGAVSLLRRACPRILQEHGPSADPDA